MQQHVKTLAILHIVLGALGVLGGLVAMTVLGGLGGLLRYADVSNELGSAEGGVVLGLIGVIIMIVVFAVSLPGLIAGIGLLSFQPWARILMIIVSAFDLPGVPLHTALGIYGLWVLLSNEGAALFARSRPA